MSRSLDSGVAESLRAGDHLAAYRAISEVFPTRPTDGLLELEILGKSHLLPDGCYVLQDGCAAGVSKLGLIQAFFIARRILEGHLSGTASRTPAECLAATAVMLFMDPEHLTAANTRKRLLQRQMEGDDNARASLQTEKHFVDSLLTSRLHRHTKSPVLWSHRRWLIQVSVSLNLPVDVLGDITKVVCVAAERHPRNYYAWCHARFLTGLGTWKSSGEEVYAVVYAWCFQHHTDISGWSFLYFLLDSGTLSDPLASRQTLLEVLRLVDSLRLTNESVWVFLRTLAASGLVGDDEYSRFLAAGRGLLESPKTSTEHGVLWSAIEWCKTYRTNLGHQTLRQRREEP